MPTASAVTADLIDTAVGRTAITFRTLELWSDKQPRVSLSEHARAEGRYYMRFTVHDHPGVLAQVAGILGQYSISIASVIQRDRKAGTTVPLVLRTHRVRERNLRRALDAIKELAVVRGRPVSIRIEEQLA